MKKIVLYMLFSALFSCSAQEAKIIHKLSVKTFKEHIVGAKVQLIFWTKVGIMC